MRIGTTKRVLTLILALSMVVSTYTVMTFVQADPQASTDSPVPAVAQAYDGPGFSQEALLTDTEGQSAVPASATVADEAESLIQSTVSEPDNATVDSTEVHGIEAQTDDTSVDLEAALQVDMPQASAQADVHAVAPQAVAQAEADTVVDLTALKEAVALAPDVEERKDSIVGIFYTDYMNLVEEAKTEYLEKENTFTQDQVDAMTDALVVSYQRLMDGEYDKDNVLQNLKSLIARYEELSVINSNPQTAFPVDGWVYYHTAAVKAKQLLATDAYDYNTVGLAIFEINRTYEAIKSIFISGTSIPKYSESMIPRTPMINRVGFQVKSAYGGRTVRLAVNTIASFNVKKVTVLDENGVEVPVRVTASPANSFNPDEKLLYVDLVLDTEPGMHTYTVYVCQTNSQGKVVLFFSQPMQCSIRVK